MTANEADRVPSSGTHVPVRRYRVSYKHGVIEEDGSPREATDSKPMVLAAAYDTLRDQLQASQCAEAMLTDEVRGLKEQRDALRADAGRLRVEIETLTADLREARN